MSSSTVLFGNVFLEVQWQKMEKEISRTVLIYDWWMKFIEFLWLESKQILSERLRRVFSTTRTRRIIFSNRIWMNIIHTLKHLCSFRKKKCPTHDLILISRWIEKDTKTLWIKRKKAEDRKISRYYKIKFQSF